jgi:hypothetical protein
MINWKTTVVGIITALLAFVAFDPQWFPPIVVSIAKFAAIGGLASLGLVSKDHDVTGGTKTQPTVSNPSSLIEK